MTQVTMKLITRLPNGSEETIELKGTCSDSLSNLKTLWDAERTINEWSRVRAHVEIAEEKTSAELSALHPIDPRD